MSRHRPSDVYSCSTSLVVDPGPVRAPSELEYYSLQFFYMSHLVFLSQTYLTLTRFAEKNTTINYHKLIPEVLRIILSS